jgi:hypothetical protein
VKRETANKSNPLPAATPAPLSIAGLDVPAALVPVFQQRPLTLYESTEEYDAILADFTSAVRPIDIFEWTWVKDLADTYWESCRLKRVRNQLLEKESSSSLFTAFKTALDNWAHSPEEQGEAEEIAEDLRRGRIAKVEAFMEAKGIVVQYSYSEVYARRLGEFDTIDKMLALADSRRDRVLRDIDRRRDSALRRRVVELHAQLLQSERPEPKQLTNGADRGVSAAH